MANGVPVDVGQVLADQLVKAAKVVEEQLDAELHKYNLFYIISIEIRWYVTKMIPFLLKGMITWTKMILNL